MYRMIITGIMGHSSRGDRIHRISFRLGTPMPRACVSWWALEAWVQKISQSRPPFSVMGFLGELWGGVYFGWDATGFFGVFFPGEMQWGSRGKTRVALCTLGKHIATLSLGKVASGSNA